MNTKIKELPSCERPYEKAFKYGVEVLSDVELVAVFIKSGTKDKSSIEIARELLRMPDGSYSLLAIFRKSFLQLKAIPGIGAVKAITLKCIAEFSKRISTTGYGETFKIDDPKTVSNYYMEKLRHLNEEQVVAVFLNSKNCFICDKVISTGAVNKSIIPQRELFLYALNCSAVYIILLHNHPSGDPTPSNDDISSTDKIVEAGNLVGIKVLDHIIIGDNKYYSFRERGLI